MDQWLQAKILHPHVALRGQMQANLGDGTATCASGGIASGLSPDLKDFILLSIWPRINQKPLKELPKGSEP